MPFNNEQLKALDNTTYQELGDADILAEHQEQLELLSAEDKRSLAIKLVHQCPEKELTRLRQAIQALKLPATSEETPNSFHQVVIKVWEIRKKICALQDSLNPKPHTLLLEPEFNADLFAEFNDFSLSLLDKNEMSIAQNLAKTTPKERRNELVRNIQIAFPDSQFVTSVGAIFAFLRELDVLLGEEPYKFFTSPEFNAKAYVQYDELLAIIANKDEEIAAKLANTPNIKRPLVLANLELMFPDSILLERTKVLFETPAKETVHENSIFSSAPSVPEADKAKEEAKASFHC